MFHLCSQRASPGFYGPSGAGATAIGRPDSSRWMAPAEAADAVHEPDLAALIRDFDAMPLAD